MIQPRTYRAFLIVSAIVGVGLAFAAVRAQRPASPVPVFLFSSILFSLLVLVALSVLWPWLIRWTRLRTPAAAVSFGVVSAFAVSLIVFWRMTDGMRFRYEQKVRDGKNGAKEDIEFHLALLRATRNEVLQNMADLVVESFREDLFLRYTTLHSIPDDQAGIADHWAILLALQQRDLAAAQEAMRQHFYHFIPDAMPSSKPTR